MKSVLVRSINNNNCDAVIVYWVIVINFEKYLRIIFVGETTRVRNLIIFDSSIFYSTRDQDQATNAEDVLFDMFKNEETNLVPVGKFLAVRTILILLLLHFDVCGEEGGGRYIYQFIYINDIKTCLRGSAWKTRRSISGSFFILWYCDRIYSRLSSFSVRSCGIL